MKHLDLLIIYLNAFIVFISSLVTSFLVFQSH